MSTIRINEGTRRELDRFKAYMQNQEYTDRTATGYRTYLSRFLRQQTELLEASTLKGAAETFLETEKVRHPQTFKYCRAALNLYYRMVAGESLRVPPETSTAPEIAVLLQRFRAYSLTVKHLEPDTVASEISHASRFLAYVAEHSSQRFVNGLMAEDIRIYLMEQLTTLKDSSKGRMITSIRNFFRCQAFYGQPVHPSIFRLPLSPAVWKKSAFPTTLNMEMFITLHQIPNENTHSGKRDRCIILCFTELALRCSEVAALTLDDFNWHGGYVTIRNTKNGSDRILPIPTILGRDLVEYLTLARPQTSCRTLFVRFSHQRGEPMGCSQIRNVVRRNSAKAGLEDHACGTHILRRTAATKLYNAGNSLKLTADILGHKSLDSTTHYAKGDIAGLLSVASPWPGGERHGRE
ncbi:tyrosine-type recombinase/integrase [Paenibacillaceae bacterium WGS1546]|uniref:tyrosine-type recombinase/integrase n=1 Tax=Cohnella sp. WGS1546 TaxID=3366810 RepID=UPI00372D1434